MLRLYDTNYSKHELLRLYELFNSNLANLMDMCDKATFPCNTCPYRHICDDFDRIILFLKDKVNEKCED